MASIDVWDTAIRSYKKNHPDSVALCKDLREYPPETFVQETGIREIDAIVGGPPCQGFSLAGRRDPSDPRNSLFMEFAKYICFFRPKIFVMENVTGILTMKTAEGQSVLGLILETFREAGYKVEYKILKASDYGVPQIRRRVFFIGVLNHDTPISFPEPETASNPPAIGPYLVPEDQADERLFLSERALQGIRKKKKAMEAKGHGFGAQFIDPTKPCYTVPARYWKDGYDALVRYSDTRVRRLNTLELRRVQSFPDNYILEGTKKDVVMQIGNAVASRVGYHLGRHLFTLVG